MEQNSRKLILSGDKDIHVREKEYQTLMATLKELSIAELDFELRSLLFLP